MDYTPTVWIEVSRLEAMQREREKLRAALEVALVMFNDPDADNFSADQWEVQARAALKESST